MKKLNSVIEAAFYALTGNARRRYEARHLLLQALASRLGFRVYNRNLAWAKDTHFKQVWCLFPKGDNTIQERRFNLFNLARTMRVVPGDLAECGVFHGGGSYLMLSANVGLGKHLFGFDSFEGLSEPGVLDQVETDYTFEWRKNDLSVGEAVAARNLAGFSDQVTLLKGWIPERFSEVAGRRFSMVHIDVDLYEPTRDAARFFYPLLNIGGMIVCDDYGFESCPGARRAMDEVAAEFGTCVAHLTTGQGIVFKVK